MAPGIRTRLKAVAVVNSFQKKRGNTNLSELREFIALLHLPEVHEHASELLPELLLEGNDLGLDNAGLAKHIPTTEATLSRWRKKENATHPAIARAAIEVMAKQAETLLATLVKKKTGD